VSLDCTDKNIVIPAKAGIHFRSHQMPNLLEMDTRLRGGDEETDCSKTIRFAGYAAIFNRIDKGGDIIRPGAFGALASAYPVCPELCRRELVEGSLPLLWQHSPDKRIGSVDYIREDRRGLRVIGSILTATKAGRDAAAMVRGGTLKGLSFGYRVKKANGKNPRELLELDVAEISLVTFPMQTFAIVISVQ